MGITPTDMRRRSTCNPPATLAVLAFLHTMTRARHRICDRTRPGRTPAHEGSDVLREQGHPDRGHPRTDRPPGHGQGHDRVVVEPYLTCGSCPRCRAGIYNVCDTLGFIGLSGGGGGFSEYVVADARRTFGIGRLGTDIGALVEPLAVAYHAVRLSKAGPGSTATVYGSGPIGLVTVAALKAKGVEKVIVVEPAGVRKVKATAAGADHVVDPTDSDVVATVKDLTDGVGTDVSFECAGFDGALAQAVQGTKGGGTVVNVAIWGHPATVVMNDLVFNEVSIVGALAYCNDHEPTIKLLQDGLVDAGQFITGRIALDDIVDGGFHELINRKAENVKILVHP